MVDKEERDYCCGWCSTKFKQKVGIGGSAGKYTQSSPSDQVKCPGCKNILKT